MVKKLCTEGRGGQVKMDWSFLPDGILAKIGEALVAEDVLSYIAFRGVCSYWRKATEDPTITERRFSPSKWMMMWGSDEYDPNRFSSKMEFGSKPQRKFLNPSTGRYIQTHIPQLRNTIVNSCLEGLLLITRWGRGRVTSRLLNPFTGSMIEYPDISRFLNTLAKSGNDQPPSFTFATSSSFTILVIASHSVAYADPGNEEWKFISLGPHYHHSFVFFQGSPYSFSVTGGLVRFDFEKTQKNLVECRLETLIAGPPSDVIPIRGRGVERYYVVECNGEMLAVLWSPWTRASEYFRIFKVVNREIREGGGGCEISLVPVRNIGNHALFIHPWHPGFSVSTEKFQCFLPNSIYFFKKGLSAPRIFSPFIKQTLFSPELSQYYWPIEELYLVSKRFSPFPIPVSRRRHRGVRAVAGRSKRFC
ncbi:hypothetical protein FCM35_KLT12685 [Carex littledalei]|uniref:KIB1-4 beta-propeller domain-containing protein n=1 Tax=Carex littledalei TaxID=544730 RepID=A0A833QHZ7_9POAL|nr:hypothetical protein FCM35_KLT12685 [Carex littledalei]